MKTFTFAIAVCTLAGGIAHAQNQQNQQSGQQGQGQGPSQSAPGTTAPAPVKPGSVKPPATQRIITTPRPLDRSSIRPVTPRKVTVSQAPRTVATTRELMAYGPRSPRSGQYVIKLPQVGDASSVKIIPLRAGICGWKQEDLRGAAGRAVSATGSSTNAECRRAWQSYADRIGGIRWQGRGSRISGFYPRSGGGIPSDLLARFHRQPHVVQTRFGNRMKVSDFSGVGIYDTDVDRDGVHAIAHGGSDCDDNDPNRYTGNVEIADFAGNDEDCDPSSIGTLDRDGDGFTDARVFNRPWDRRGRPVYGKDCDDTRRGVHPNVPEVPNNGLDDNCDGDIDF